MSADPADFTAAAARGGRGGSAIIGGGGTRGPVNTGIIFEQKPVSLLDLFGDAAARVHAPRPVATFATLTDESWRHSIARSHTEPNLVRLAILAATTRKIS